MRHRKGVKGVVTRKQGNVQPGNVGGNDADGEGKRKTVQICKY